MLKVTKYGAPWCGPCKMLDPVLHELQDEFKEVEFEFIDIDTDEGANKAAEAGVMGIPRVFFEKDGETVEDINGFVPKGALEELINQHK